MSVLEDLKPTKKLLVMNLLKDAGYDVRAWANYGGPPTSNPKYCYNWSFEQPGEFVVLCLWHRDFKSSGKRIVHDSLRPKRQAGSRGTVGNARARALDLAIGTAFRQQLPVRVIVVDKSNHIGRSRKGTSRVSARALDPVAWAVVEYDYQSGRRLLVRGEKPTEAPLEVADAELVGFEGKKRNRFIAHRQRESWMRRAKVHDAMQRNGGRLVCEVRKCGFDFVKRYGPLGDGYAHVHHLTPLSRALQQGREVRLSDLAIVCANCHAMIHRNGESRPLDSIIP